MLVGACAAGLPNESLGWCGICTESGSSQGVGQGVGSKSGSKSGSGSGVLQLNHPSLGTTSCRHARSVCCCLRRPSCSRCAFCASSILRADSPSSIAISSASAIRAWHSLSSNSCVTACCPLSCKSTMVPSGVERLPFRRLLVLRTACWTPTLRAVAHARMPRELCGPPCVRQL
jgi:hypothetical protein